MDWIQGIQQAIEYIESHLTEHIDYNKAARCAYSFKEFSEYCAVFPSENISEDED